MITLECGMRDILREEDKRWLYFVKTVEKN